MNEHVEKSWDHHGVYVLACRKRPLPAAKRVALEELTGNDGERIDNVPGWVTAAARADHLLYVGLSKRMVERIHSHAHAKGAHFTKVFPPSRILNIDWYPTLWQSYNEEPKKADELRDRFPEAYVSQPG